MNRDFRRSVPLKSAFTLLVLSGVFFAPLQPCYSKRTPQPKKVVVSEKPTLDLIEKLGHQPELLTPEYLQYVLGRPAKRNVSTGGNTVYHWLENGGGIGTLDCELMQTRDANQKLIRASFKVNIPRSTVTLADIEKKINEDRGNFADRAAAAGAPGSSPNFSNSPTAAALAAQARQSQQPQVYQATTSSGDPLTFSSPALVPLTGRKLFDQECRPSLQYSFVPYTKVLYTQAPNTFHVHRAQIDYVGPPLPPPSQTDIAEVATGMRSRALAHQMSDKNHYAVPMLHDHLSENPGDAEAHYALGRSYQQASHLNEAISEYQLALRYSNGNDVVANNATQSLQLLHVLPSPDDKLDYHTLRFKQHGQGLTEGDVVATQDRRSLLANRAPLYTTNASNPADATQEAPGRGSTGLPASPNAGSSYPGSSNPGSSFPGSSLQGSSFQNSTYRGSSYPAYGYAGQSAQSANSMGRSTPLSFTPGVTGSQNSNSNGGNLVGGNNVAGSSSTNSSGMVELHAPPAGSLSDVVKPRSLASRSSSSNSSPTGLAAALRPPMNSSSQHAPDPNAPLGSQLQNVRYSPDGNNLGTTPAVQQATDGQKSFYNSMQYGANLFPATASNPNLEPGF